MRSLLLSCAAAAAFLVPSDLASALTPQAPPAKEPAGNEPAPAGQEPAPPAKDGPGTGTTGTGTETPKDEGNGKGAAAHAGWTTSYEDALARAKKEKKLILADFTGTDWCIWCIRLNDEVFSKPEFQKWAEKNVILLELDFPRKKELPKELVEQNAKLKDEHKIRGFPTILFLDAKGKKVGQMGYEAGGPENWVKKAEKVVKKAKGK